jgi:CheY-like chemotaxis protein
MNSAIRTVAIFNASADTVEMLMHMLSLRGHRVIAGSVDEVKSGELDLIDFVETHHPDALVWDVAPPYDRNWRILKLVRSLRQLQQCPVIVTTTNRERLDALVGLDTGALEIAGKPYDIELIVSQAERAVETARPPRSFGRVAG